MVRRSGKSSGNFFVVSVRGGMGSRVVTAVMAVIDSG